MSTLCLVTVTMLHAAWAWDPDAGMIPSYTKSDNASVTATTGRTPENVIDGNDNTNWVSGSCLPNYYISRQDINILHGACSKGDCLSAVTSDNLTEATDGNAYTVADVNYNSTVAMITLNLVSPMVFQVVSVSGIYNSNVTLYSYDTSGHKRELMIFQTSDNYKNINIQNMNHTITKLELVSFEAFKIKEIGAIGPAGCTEEITVDLGSIKPVGAIRTRHWAGTNSASALELRLSADGKTWDKTVSLNPDALHAVTTDIPQQKARYISLKYTVNLVNYKKVYCFEIDVWDENGIWGPKFAAKPQTKTFRELLGVNGIWGWGTNKYSDTLGSDKGPLLYAQVASHGRNYHNLLWDVTDPDLDPEFAEMAAGHGTQAKWWLNWDKEYKAWKDANMTVDISIQFLNKTVPQSVWNTPEQSAFHYGQELAKHFGPSRGNKLVSAVEVGNEPWDYDAAFYATVLKGMSAGIRSIDRNLTVVTGTFQAQDKLESNTYIGTRVLEDAASNIDVINCHTYSFINDENGVRRGTFPEQKDSMFNNVRPLIRWRDANTPGKPIWVTEWGWDADGQGENCKATECVSERAQAVYAIRGLLILARTNIEKATWYFYANTDCETLFCRSGLTTSVKTDFRKKTVFRIFDDFLHEVGNTYFLGVVQENDCGYVYALSETENINVNPAAVLASASHVIAWLPVDINDTSSQQLSLHLPHGARPSHAIRFTGDVTGKSSHVDNSFSISGNLLTMTLTAEPYLVRLQHVQTSDISVEPVSDTGNTLIVSLFQSVVIFLTCTVIV